MFTGQIIGYVGDVYKRQGVGRAFHDFPSQLQQEIGQRNGCFYLIEIDFHNVDWIS